MTPRSEGQYPLLAYIEEMSDSCRVSLSLILDNQDLLRHTTFWYHHFNADGHNHEGLFQLLWGKIELDGRCTWTMFNFHTGEVSQRWCWGSEPYFYVVGDDDEDGYNDER